MITVEMYVCDSTNDVVFKIYGHAGYAPFGEDPVCAVATGYAQQAILIAQALFKEDKLEKRPRIVKESGRVVVVMRPRTFCHALTLHSYDIEKAEIIAELRTVISGFDWLVKEYPEFIQFGNAKA